MVFLSPMLCIEPCLIAGKLVGHLFFLGLYKVGVSSTLIFFRGPVRSIDFEIIRGVS